MSANNSYHTAKLISRAAALVAPGKGILAADESPNFMGERFGEMHLASSEDSRKNYREVLIKAEGIEQFISGVILCEDTLFEDAKDGTPFVHILKSKGIIPGVKADLGTEELYGMNGETITLGLDTLKSRCAIYYAQGARFAKWRAVLHIKDGDGITPSQLAINSNLEALARCAVICQHNGLVPILQPEIICMGDFGIDAVEAVTEKVLSSLFKVLLEHHVLLEAMILNPNMVRSGFEAAVPAWPADIGAATVRVIKRTVPSAVKGITFSSGGMTEEQAILALNAINQEARADGVQPWPLTFSFGRALQDSALQAWQGSSDRNNILAAQKALYMRGKASGYAAIGGYYSSIETMQV